MSARLFANVVYAWLLAGSDGDPPTREKLDAHIYAPAQGSTAADASFWAAILTGTDGEGE